MSKENVLNIVAGVAITIALLGIAIFLLTEQGNSYPRSTNGWIELSITLIILPVLFSFKYRHIRAFSIFGAPAILITGFAVFAVLVKDAHISIAAFFVLYALVAQIGIYFILNKLGKALCQNS